MPVFKGTEGYAAEAQAAIPVYEGIDFHQLNAPVLPLLPPAPARLLDVGAGSGRDAAGFAALGYQVTAVEPVEALREAGKRRHSEWPIIWVNDGLPGLRQLCANPASHFDAITLQAVWMHLDVAERRAGMETLSSLLNAGGRLFLSLRHGPVPPGKCMFDVSAEETVSLAESNGLSVILQLEGQSSLLPKPDVTWTRLGFEKA